MDLTIQLNNIKLNIRVAVLIKTSKGYIFEKGNDGYFFTLGGRVKINESSLEAAQREVREEIDYDMTQGKLVAIVENFFGPIDAVVHEICFVYRQHEMITVDLPSNFLELDERDLINKDIRPEIIRKIIIDTNDGIAHYILK